MAGLAPTLIIVRVGYRKSVDSVQQMVSIHLAEHGSQWEAGNRAVQTTLNIPSHPQDVDATSGHGREAMVQEEHNEGQIG
ncbi:hypothetical protein PQX77_016771 [Marasmius sp. AFHP31]|nr:hypothetical protein PQX77_016771 [Marasmius sp. AFHP31]